VLRADLELRINDVFRHFADLSAPMKLLLVLVSLALGAILFDSAGALGTAIVLLVLYFFLLGWVYGAGE